MLVGTAITVYQVLSKPQPVAATLSVSAAQANAQAFDQKLEQVAAPRGAGSAPAEVHFTSDEVSSEMAQAAGAIPAAPQVATKPVNSASRASGVTAAPGGTPDQVNVKNYQVKLDGDIAHGQFLTQVAGRDI